MNMNTSSFSEEAESQRRHEQQLQRLVGAAQVLYLHEGIGAVSYEHIAAYAQLPAKAVHRWFPQKAALVHQALGAYTDEMRRDFAAQNARSTTAVAELLALREWLRQEMGQVHPLVFQELEEDYPATSQLWQEHCAGFVVNHIRNNLRWGIVQQLYHAHLDADFLARLWLQQMSTRLKSRPSQPPGLNPIEIRQTLADHFLAGIVTTLGAHLTRRIQESPEDFFSNNRT